MLGIWDPEELVQSNNNLVEIDIKREEGKYVVSNDRGHHNLVIDNLQIPEGGIQAGLCGRMVLI